MKKITLNAYLLFDNNCREAMAFYKGIFGGEVTARTFGEVDNSCPEAMRDSIMHSSLMGGDVEFFACDNPNPQAAETGNGKISLALGGHDEERLRQIYEALSTGGKIIFALEKQGWGDIFGVLSDQFGINWMVNIRSNPPHEKPGL